MTKQQTAHRRFRQILDAQHKPESLVALPPNATLVKDPDVARTILTSQPGVFSKGSDYNRVRLLVSDGLLTSDGERWRQQRRLATGILNQQILQRLTQESFQVHQTQYEQLKTRSYADVPEDPSAAVLEIALKYLFGSQAHAQDFVALFDFLVSAPHNFEFVERYHALREPIRETVDAHLAKQTQDQGCALGFMIAQNNKHNLNASAEDLVEQLLTLIIASHETTTASISWMWLALADGDRTRSQAKQAAKQLPRSTSSADLTNSTLNEMFNETLRLYPPAWLVTRRAEVDCTVAGLDVCKGDEFYISPYLLHRSEPWGETAEHFCPHRQRGDTSTYIPFGIGPRRCIGERFARIVALTHFATWLRHTDFKIVKSATIEDTFGLNYTFDSGIQLVWAS